MVGTHGISLGDIGLVGEDKALQADANEAAGKTAAPVQEPHGELEKAASALPPKSEKTEPAAAPEQEAQKEANTAPVPGSLDRLKEAMWGLENEPGALQKLHTAVWVPGGEEAQARGNALADPTAATRQQSAELDRQISQLQVSERNDPFHENVGLKAQTVTITGDLESKREVFATLAAHQEKAVGGIGMDENAEKASIPPHVLAALEGLPNPGKFKVENLSPDFGASDTHEPPVHGAAGQNIQQFKAEQQALAAAQPSIAS